MENREFSFLISAFLTTNIIPNFLNANNQNNQQQRRLHQTQSCELSDDIRFGHHQPESPDKTPNHLLTSALYESMPGFSVVEIYFTGPCDVHK